jgi:sugar phosphate isomerase/epimerase
MPLTQQRISPPSGSAEAVNQVKSDYCRICIDVGHQALFHRDIGEDIRIAGKKMACLHVHDSDGYNDIHILPFTGVTNWDSFTDALAEIVYSGSMNLETETARCHYSPPHLTRMTEELLAATARYLADEVERKKNI